MTAVQIAHQILRKFDSVGYGYLDAKGVIHRESDPGFDQADFKDYRLQSAEQVEQNQIGVCWDQVEYARALFSEHNIPTETYAIVYYDHENDSYFNHTILTFRDGEKYYWFEHSMKYLAGVHEFTSRKDLLLKLRDEFIASQSKNIPVRYKKDRLRIWRYDVLTPNSTPAEIFHAWESGESVGEEVI